MSNSKLEMQQTGGGAGPAGPWGSSGQSTHCVPGPGSPFRDEITLAILQLQENNRLEILKRKWWEGGRCPKEEDHRAKGQPQCLPCPLKDPSRPPMPTQPSPGSPLTPRSGHGKHRRHFCRAHLWPHHRCLRGGHGVHMVHAEVSRVRRGEEVGGGCQEGSRTPGADEPEDCGTGSLTGGEEVARRVWAAREVRGPLSPGAEKVEKRREQTDRRDNSRA